MRPAMRTAAGFTLVEILVSILIFSVVSVAMVTILLTSTNIFRAGQYGRASTDEAVAAMAAIDEDLKRMVPPRDGGFVYSILHHFDPAAAVARVNGNCFLAFMIATGAETTQRGRSGRKLVVYWVETVAPGTGDEDEVLYRAVAPVAADSGLAGNPRESDVVAVYYNDPHALPAGWEAPTVVARRCLHFGAWISSDVERRAAADDWTQSVAGTPIRPYTDPGGPKDYCTEAAGATPADPPPTAIRITLSLAAGRYAPRGIVIDDTSAGIRIAGLPSVPLQAGAMVRIEDEWIAYSDFSGGRLITLPRPALRSATAVHGRNAPVRIGQMYAVARIFPH